jgi:uncharacterized delta-60 repeat protein
MARTPALVALVLLGALLLTPSAVAVTPGDPDTRFGSGGEVLLDPSKELREIAGLAEQPDRKLIVTGSVGTKLPIGAVLRLREDGTPDRGFAANGLARLGTFGVAGTPVLQPDGGIVVWSARGRDEAPPSATLSRLDSEGRFDTTFGQNGFASADRPGFQPRGAFGLADGGVVLVGTEAGPGGARGAVARFRPDGSLDPAFGSGGYATVEPAGQNGLLVSGAEQPGRGIVVAGEFKASGSPGGGTEYRWTAARLTDSGTLDPSFGQGGLAQDSFRGQGGGFSEIAPGPQGTFVLAGSVPIPWADGRSGYGIARITADGAQDPSFGDGGRAYVEVPVDGAVHAQVPQVATLHENRMAIAGQHLRTTPSFDAISGWVLGRLDGDGRIDAGFGREGWAATSHGPGWLRPRELIRTAAGGLVLAANAADCDNERAGLFRFHSDDAEPNRAGAGPIMRTCGSTARQSGDGTIPIEVQCPAIELGCSTTMQVEIPSSELRKSASAAPLLVGIQRGVDLAGGEVTTVRIRARSAARRVMARRRSVRARVVFRAVDRRGWVRTSKRSMVLKAPKNKR